MVFDAPSSSSEVFSHGLLINGDGGEGVWGANTAAEGDVN